MHDPGYDLRIPRIDFRSHGVKRDTFAVSQIPVVAGGCQNGFVAPGFQSQSETHIRIDVAIGSPSRQDDACHTDLKKIESG
jgi:hypothetical protein